MASRLMALGGMERGIKERKRDEHTMMEQDGSVVVVKPHCRWYLAQFRPYLRHRTRQVLVVRIPHG